MTKKRTRQSTRRQAKKLEMTSIQIEILNGLSRDLDQFLEEQRQQAARDLIDEATVHAVSEEQNTQRAGSRKAMG
jgi:hypothetical protein